MFLYFGLFLFLVFLGITVNRKQEIPVLVVLLFGLTFFMGTRYYVGCDFFAYFLRFENKLSGISNSNYALMQEVGFERMTDAVIAVGLDFMWLNVVASVIMLSCYFLFLRQHHEKLLVLALMFPIVLIQLSMSGIRQGIAVAMLAAATSHFIKKQRLLTGGWILLGMQFHTSVIVFLPLAFLPGRKISQKNLYLGILIAVPLALYLLSGRMEVYQDRYVTQMHGNMVAGGAFVRYFLVLVPALMFLRFKKEIMHYWPEKYALFEIFMLITLSLSVLALLNTVLLHRMIYYIMPVSIAMFICCVACMFSLQQRKMGYLGIAGLYGFYMLYWLLNSRHADLCFIPYQSYLY